MTGAVADTADHRFGRGDHLRSAGLLGLAATVP